MKRTLLFILTVCILGCTENKQEYTELPIICKDKDIDIETEDYEFVDQNIKIKIPKGWSDVDYPNPDFDGRLFGDTTKDYYASSTFAVMVYDNVTMPLQEYFELDYESTLSNKKFSKTKKGKIIIDGRQVYWQFAHDKSDGHSITVAYYVKDEKTDRVIMIPSSTYLVDDYEDELCKLKRLIETIEIK